MDFYSIFKLLHVISAIAWVGGGMTILASATFSMREKGPAEVIRVAQQMGGLAMRWFLPASLLTLLFGIIVTFIGGLWSQAWIIIGLAGFASTALTGHFVLRVKGERIVELVKEGRQDEAVAEGQAMMRVAKFDYTVILVVVADMVLKPGWTSFVTLGLMTAAIAIAAYFFLYRDQSSAEALPAA